MCKCGADIGNTVLLFLNILLLWIDRRIFYGNNSFLPPDSATKVVDEDTWNLFSFAPATDATIDAALLLIMASAVLLVLGRVPRLAAAISFLLLIAIQHANIMLFDAEDTVFRLFAFYLIMVPPWNQLRMSAAALEKDGDQHLTMPVWPLRLFQIQICLIYFCSAIQKSDGAEWLDGTALYYALRLDDATRFPLPNWIVDSMAWMRLLTWSVFLFESIAPILIWWRKTRVYCLAAAFLFHLGTDYSMNLHLFHWIMMNGLLSFVHFDELCRLWQWFRFRRPPVSPRVK